MKPASHPRTRGRGSNGEELIWTRGERPGQRSLAHCHTSTDGLLEEREGSGGVVSAPPKNFLLLKKDLYVCFDFKFKSSDSKIQKIAIVYFKVL